MSDIDLPALDDVQLDALEQIASLDKTLEPITKTILSVVRELRSLRADAAVFKQEYNNACGTIAMMHACAVGDRNGPRAGVVEDIINLREYAIRSRIALDECIDLTEKQETHIGQLAKARDQLGAIALELSDPRDEVERARIKALLKVGSTDGTTTQEAPTLILPG